MKIHEHILLRTQTTLRIGGPASFFCTVQNISELKDALAFAKNKNIPFFILGGGSNILVSDSGFQGLVIKMEIKGIERGKVTDQENILVTASAGESWDEFVARTVEMNLWGLENLAAIPGTVGASPVQNIGAYGVEVMNSIHSVNTLDALTGKEVTFLNTECVFSYRYSFFKKAEYKRYIITSVVFNLSSKPKPNITYKDLREYFEKADNVNPSQMEIRNAVVSIRSKKFPDLSKIGTAGSFWKNPIISKEMFEKLKREYPLMPSFPFGDRVKIPLAWVLDNVCGLKGYSLGAVGLYENQPLVLVSHTGGTSHDVNQLGDKVSALVKEKTGIEIEREVEWVP